MSTACVVANRTLSRAEALREQFGPRVLPVDWRDLAGRLNGCRLLVNTTSLGMKGQPPLDIELTALSPDALVTDIVYVPLETPLLKAAKARGLATVDGLGMLLHQAVPGFERWFGVRPQVTAELRNLALADLAAKGQLYVTAKPFRLGLTGSIGMGKSTTAQIFRELGVPVHDADAAVHAIYGEEGIEPVEAAFPGVTIGGRIDRTLLGAKVLGDDAAMKRLEAIVHPLVRARERAFLERAAEAGKDIAVLDIPLLFESGRRAASTRRWWSRRRNLCSARVFSPVRA